MAEGSALHLSRLQTRAMDSLQLLEGGRLATMRVRRQDFADTKANANRTKQTAVRNGRERFIASHCKDINL